MIVVSTTGLMVILIDSVVYGFTSGLMLILIDCGFNAGLMVILIDSVVSGFDGGIDDDIDWLWFRRRV